MPRRIAYSSTLSRREIEVLTLVVAGRLDKQIADALGISRDTVRKHLESAYVKLDAPNRTAAAVEFARRRAS